MSDMIMDIPEERGDQQALVPQDGDTRTQYKKLESLFGHPILYATEHGGRVAFVDSKGIFYDGLRYDFDQIAGVGDQIFYDRSAGVGSAVAGMVGGTAQVVGGCLLVPVYWLGGFFLVVGVLMLLLGGGNPGVFIPLGIGIFLVIGLIQGGLQIGTEKAVEATAVKTHYLTLHMQSGVEKKLLEGFPPEELQNFINAYLKARFGC